MAKTTPSNPFDTSDFMATLRAKLDRVENDPEFVKELQAEHKGNPMTLGPLVIPPEEWAEKQVKRAADAASEWERNVQRPRRNPITAAIASAPKRAEKVRESLEQGKFEKAMAKVDENLMYETIRKRGASAFRSGIEDRKAKVLARVKELQPMVAALAQTIQAMPDVTDDNREKRLIAARRGMIEVGKRRLGI